MGRSAKPFKWVRFPFTTPKYQVEMKTFQSLIEDQIKKAFHGSPHKFNTFQTNDVFLAKNKEEAMRYGPHIYEVSYVGKEKFDTPTISVIAPSQVIKVLHIEHNPSQKIYRT